MADDRRISGTKPLPALEEDGGGERGEDPSSVTADARQGLEDDLSRLLGKPAGPAPRGPQPATEDVAYAQTQELGVLDDTAPRLPTAEAIGVLDDTAPRLPTAREMGVSMKLAANAPADPHPAPKPPSTGRVAEACDEVMVFTEAQLQQVKQAVQRKETAQQALAPVPTDPVRGKGGGGVALLLALLIVGVVVVTALVWVLYLT